jgi:L-malate glycosyltransferase
MKILHLSTARTFRGGERQVQWLHEGLLARDHQSTLLCRAGGGLADRDMPSSVPVAWHSELDPGSLMRYISTVRRARPDILHCHDAHAVSHGAVAGTLLHIPVVATRRVLVPIRKHGFSRWKYRRCEKVIAISAAVAHLCEDSVGRDRVAIVPDGVDADAPMKSRADARQELGLKGEAFVLATVGHFTKEKNAALISAVVEHLGSVHPEVQVVCIGPMSEDAIQNLAAAPNVVLAGEMIDPARLYSAFDLYISTSRHEGLGTALLDAVVRDIPVVATDAGGTRDIFPAGYRLIAPGDPLAFVRSVDSAIDNFEEAKARARQIGPDARKRFSLANVIEGTIGVYDYVVKGRRR